MVAERLFEDEGPYHKALRAVDHKCSLRPRWSNRCLITREVMGRIVIIIEYIILGRPNVQRFYLDYRKKTEP